MTLETFDVKLTKQTLVSTGPYIYSRGGHNLSNDVSKHNQDVWDALAQSQCAWSQPVSPDVIKAAKAGHWQVHITKKALTENWLPKNIQGKKYCVLRLQAVSKHLSWLQPVPMLLFSIFLNNS